jgi:hypothetical protein
LAERYAELSTADKEVLHFSAQEVWDERMHAAGLANDPVAFRAALKAGSERGSKLWKSYESREVPHEFFE